MKNKEKLIKIGITILTILIVIFMVNKIDKKEEISKTITQSKVSGDVLNASKKVKGNETVKYEVKYTPKNSNKIIIEARINSVEYAHFKEKEEENVISKIKEEGKVLELTVSNLEINKEYKTEIEIELNNAPNGYSINPSIKIKENEEEVNVGTESVEVETTGITGRVINEKTKEGIKNIELALIKENKEIKRTYTDEKGKYSISDIENGEYKLEIKEEKYEKVKEENINVNGNIEEIIEVREVEPFKVSIKKYVNNVRIRNNGKEEEYSYNKIERVQQVVKNLKEIDGEVEYKIVVKNKGKKAGYAKIIKEEIPEGMSFNKEKNSGWEEENGIIKNKTLSKSKIKAGEEKELKIVLDIEKTKEAKRYINKVSVTGEIYHKVTYINNGKIYHEEEVLEGEKIGKISDPENEGKKFIGWYTDINYTNKYNYENEVTKDIILYARYERNKEPYKVRYIDEGKVIKEELVEEGNLINEPELSEKEGYTFKGWYEIGKEEAYNKLEPVTRNIDLYSKYEKNKYTVRFINEGEEYNKQEIEYKGTITKPIDPEKKYYRFVGWYEKNSEERFKVEDEIVTRNITLYAKYEVIKYTVRFYDNDKVINEKTEYEAGSMIDIPSDPEKEGYTFKGWYKEGEDEEYNFVDNLVTEDVDLYSKYEINKYKVEYYDVNPETKKEEKVGSEEVEYNKEVGKIEEIEGQIGKKTGYTLVGWIKENKEEFVRSEKIKENIKLYTKYVEVKNGVIFDDEGRIETKEVQEGKTVEKIESKGKEGYTFKYWSKDKINEFDFNTPILETITLYAVYEINSYTLTVNPNGGMYNGSVETKTYTLNYGEEKIVETPTKEGYTFTGWTSTVPEALNEGIVTMPSSDVTLEANYEINSYTLTVKPNGGVYNGTKEETVYNLNYGEEKIVENPTKEGYTFTGWTVSKENVLENNIVTMPSSNVTLEANYEINKYTVTFINEGEEYNKQEVEYKGKVTKPEEPEKEGYTFKYWSKDKALEYNLEEEVTEDVTLYSVYEINKYTVTFENEGQVYETRKVNYKEKVNAPEENPRKENNIFRGWNKEEELYDFESEVISDITLNAVYEEVEKPVISHEPISWTNDKVMVTVTNDNHPEYSFKYKIDNGEYKDYTGPFEVLENSVVTGISIKENVESKEEIHEIKNIDKIKPTIISLEENSEIKSAVSAKIKIKAKDEESGIKEIKIYVDGEEKGSIEKEEGTVSEQTEEYEITGLEELTSYRVKIKVIDYAGNEKASDEIEVTTIEKDYVAQIIKLGEEDKSESPIRKETLEEAIEYCNITECTIQMIKGTTENVEVLEGQKIKLDLNGQIVRSESGNTIINTGDLTIIDNGEAVGQIISEQGIGVQNRKILTVGENEEELVVSTSKPNIIGNITGIESPTVDLNGSHAGVEFKFLDGRIEGNVAITGTVTETPYLYNTKVESGAKQVATLTILAEAEARINTTYYTKVSNAMNESKKGHYEESSETVQDLTKLSKTDKDTEYGFKYDEETGKLISTNQGVANSVSNSYIKIDLSDYTEDQILTVNAEVSSQQYYDMGYATVTESTSIPAYSNGTGRFIYISGEVEATDYKVTLTAGKIYYLHFGYMKDSYTDAGTDTFTINSITLSNENNETTDYTYVAKVPVLNKEPDTIELLKNITLSSPLEIESARDVVLDLRGQTLTTQTTDYVVKNHGSLRVIDSKYTDDIESAQKKYEEEEVQNQIDYDNALANYNLYKEQTQNSYNEEYKEKLNNEISSKSELKTKQEEYEKKLKEYKENLETYQNELSKNLMPKMDGITDYFDYNNFSNNEWTNSIGTGSTMDIVGNLELTDKGVKIDRISGENYSTLPIDNSGDLTIYTVAKSLGYNGDNSRFLEIPTKIGDFEKKTPTLFTNSSKNIGFGSWGQINDKSTSVSAYEYNVIAMTIDMTNKLIKLYVNGEYKNYVSLTSYGNILYLSHCTFNQGGYGNNIFKMLAVGNKLQTEEEITQNSTFLTEKYINGDGIPFVIPDTLVKPTKPTPVTNGYSTDDYVQDELLMQVDALSNESLSKMKDVSGNGNNGTMNNVTIKDNAFVFNGSNSYVDFGKATDIGLIDNHSVSIDVTMSYTESQRSKTILAAWVENVGGISLGIDDNVSDIIKQTTNNYNSNRLNNDNKLNDGKKYHLSAVYDLENKKMKLYINGILNKTVKMTLGMNLSNNSLILGSWNGTSQFFKGNIYNAKVYNKVLTEEEIKQNYKVDSARYEVNPYKLTSNTSYGEVTSSNEEDAYKVFDGNNETSWTSNSEENYILWQMPEEKTVTGFKIYGSSEASKYPKEVELLGSKDGENYDSLVTSELEQKGLNEYNTVQIETNKYDSYKYFKWKFKNDGNEISINEISFDIYDVARKILKENDNITLSKNNFTYDVKNKNDSYNYIEEKENSLNSYTSFSENMSVTYLNQKVTVTDATPITANIKLGYYNDWSNSSLGTLYIGFSKTNEINKDDFTSYIKKDLNNRTEKIEDVSVTVREPGEYYLKMILYHNSNTSSYTVYGNIYNLSISKVPIKKQAVLAESTQLGNITSTTGNVILNDENANLVLDQAIVNMNKNGSSSAWTDGITNYGIVSLKEQSIVNNNSQYSYAINNKKSGKVIGNNGIINVNSSNNGVGIYNRSDNQENLSNLTINVKTNNGDTHGIYNRKNLSLNNINILGSGYGITTLNGAELVLNEGTNINVATGVYVPEYWVSKIEVNSNAHIKGSSYGIYLHRNWNGTIYNGMNTSTLNINDGLIEGSTGVYNYGRDNYINTINLKGGEIKATNIGIDNSVSKINMTNGYIESGGNGISGSDILLNATGGTIFHKSGSAIAFSSESKIVLGGDFKVSEESIGNGIYGNYCRDRGSIILKDNVKLFATTNGIVLDDPVSLNIKDNVIITGPTGINFPDGGIVTIGEKDGIVNKEYPKINATKNAIYNTGTLNYYDGKLIGLKNSSIVGKVDDSEDNYDLFINDENDTLENVTLSIPNLEEFGRVAKVDDTYYPSIKSAIDSISGTDEKTITILKDIRTILSNEIEENKNIVIDVNGTDIQILKSTAFIENNGNLKITDSQNVVDENGYITSGNGKITGNAGLIVDNAGTLNIEKAKISALDSSPIDGSTLIKNSDNGTINMNSGMLSKASKSGKTIENSSVKPVTMTGGEISSSNAYSIFSSAGETFIKGTSKIKGTVYTTENAKTIIDENTIISSSVENYGETIINNGTINNILINQKGILTFNNGTMTVSLDSSIIRNLSDGTININGGTITNTSSYWGGGTIISNSSTGIININGGILTSDDRYSYGIQNYSSGIINVISGKIKATYYGISNVSSGKVILGTKGDLKEDNTLNVSKELPEIIAPTGIKNTGIFNFYDGIIKSTETAISGSVSEIEEGYEIITSSDETYKEIKYLDKIPVAKIKSTNVEYYSLQDAIDAAVTGDTIVMLRDVNITATNNAYNVSSDKNIIIDINGKKIDVGNSKFIENNGTLKITDSNNEVNENNEVTYGTGKITCTNGNFATNTGMLLLDKIDISTLNGKSAIDNTGDLNLINSKINSSAETSINNTESGNITVDGGSVFALRYTIKNTSIGKITINSGSITASEGTGSERSAILHKNGTLEVNGGTIAGYGSYDYRSATCGIINEATTIINSGTIIGEFSGIKNISDGLLTIFDGILQGNYALNTYSSQPVIIHNGTFKGSSYGIFNASSSVITMHNVNVISEYTGIHNQSAGTINIEKGSIEVSNTSYGQGIYNESSGTINVGIKGDKNEDNSLNVSKENPIIISTKIGIYNGSTGILNFYDGIIKAVETAITGGINEVETDYEFVTKNDDTYKDIKYLGKLPAVKLKSTDAEYYSIQEAIDASSDGDTIELLRNITYLSTSSSNVITSDKNLILNLNGYIINGGNLPVIDNKGTLKIIDSTSSEIDSVINYGTGKLNSPNGNLINNSGNLLLDKIILTTQNEKTPIVNFGNLDVSDTKIISDGQTSIGIKNEDSGTVVINGGSINATMYGIDSTSTGKITINSGNIYVSKDICRAMAAIRSTNGEIEINGGNLEGAGGYDTRTESVGIISGYRLTINDGKIIGKNTGVNSSGELFIKGGTISSIKQFGSKIVEMTGGNITGNIENNGSGKFNIKDGIYSGNLMNNSTGIMNVSGGNFSTNYNYIISNSANSTLNITGGTFKTQEKIVENFGTLNISNVTLDNVSVAISQSGGTTNIKENTIINANDKGIDISGGTLNIGEKGNVSFTDPSITGTNYGVYNTNGKIYFYDGIIKGKQNQSIYGVVTETEPGYKIRKTTENEVESSILEIIGTEERAIVVNGINFIDLQAAINAVPDNTETTMELYSNIILNSDIVIPEGKIINLYYRGYTITKGNYTITNNGTVNVKDEDTSGGILGTIKALLNIEDNNISKNVIVYEIDGENLSEEEIYLLYKKENNEYKVQNVKEEDENIGRYIIDTESNNQNMVTINKRIYLKNLKEGNYKVESSKGKEIYFEVTEEGKLIGNVKELQKDENKVMDSAFAELIITIQTGIVKGRYILLISLISVIMLLLFSIRRKKRA